MSKRKKIILIIAAIAVLVGLASGYKIMQIRADREIAKRKESVEASLQQKDSCSDGNLASLADLQADTRKDADKALHAEQLGICYGVKLAYADAAKWYIEAEKWYREAGNDVKAEAMKLAAESSQTRADAPPMEQPENAKSIDYSIGSN